MCVEAFSRNMLSQSEHVRTTPAPGPPPPCATLTRYVRACGHTFLDDRTASIRIDNYIGAPFSLLSGVPQGAGVSPTFYSFYIHDMPPPSAHCTYIAYADDITQIITYKGSYQMLAKKKTTKAIKTINDFEKKW